MSQKPEETPSVSIAGGLGSSELEILDILWRMRRATVRDVFEEVRKTRNITLPAVMISMKRLTRRALLKQEPGERGAVYEPMVTRENMGVSLVDDLINKVLAGGAAPVLSRLVDRLSDKEVKELTKLLEKAEKR
ncbi:MAG: BlaI/MecI/CopY family transcriptional regulator [Chloroflexi bacterium]|nr:BlaI/MecI/CopY family transcriptional regulator [Chloroflexota bacterium]